MTRIPVTIVTGFLGSGKTTMVRHVLEHARGKRFALIINEFGELGIDREILASCGADTCREEDMVEFANGCICCTVADDFIPTMEALLAREPRPDHIIIETSGLALPQPLVRAFNWPEIRSEVTIDGVITVVDAEALANGRFAADEAAVDAQRSADPMLDHATPLGELFADQLVSADMIVLNKTDLVDREQLKAVEEKLLTSMRPGTGLIHAANGVVDLTVLLGLDADAQDHMEGRGSAHELEHGGEGHEHDDFDSFVVTLPAVADRAELLATLTATIERFDILRLKGFAALAGHPSRLSIQAVGPRIDAIFDRPWKQGEAHETRLVIIGQTPLDRAGIETSLTRGLAAAA